MIAESGSGACWVSEWHALGWDAETRRVRERLLVEAGLVPEEGR